jgi:hypothetical protein
VSHAWLPRFIERHGEDLIGKWLPRVDRARVLAEARRECYRIWYQNVHELPVWDDLSN